MFAVTYKTLESVAHRVGAVDYWICGQADDHLGSQVPDIHRPLTTATTVNLGAQTQHR